MKRTLTFQPRLPIGYQAIRPVARDQSRDRRYVVRHHYRRLDVVELEMGHTVFSVLEDSHRAAFRIAGFHSFVEAADQRRIDDAVLLCGCPGTVLAESQVLRVTALSFGGALGGTWPATLVLISTLGAMLIGIRSAVIYFLPASIIWLCFDASGINPTIAGVMRTSHA